MKELEKSKGKKEAQKKKKIMLGEEEAGKSVQVTVMRREVRGNCL